MNNIFNKKLFFLISSFIFITDAGLVFAQETPAPDSGGMNMNNYYIILFILFILLMNAIFIPLFTSQKKIEIASAETVTKKSIISVIGGKLSGLQPLETEHSLIIDEDYDGIKELDNNVPPWFNILFYGTIIIAIIYLLNYHVFRTGKLPLQEYADEVYAANLQREELIRTGAFINETTVEKLTDKESLDKGKQIFMTNCIPCHGEAGGGTVGPNLTDEFWIHGGGIKNVFKTIKYGVPVKGMISWQTQFNPKMMQQVASYVLSLQGTKPAGGKPPEGDKFIETGDSLNAKTDSLKKDAVIKDTLKADTLRKN